MNLSRKKYQLILCAVLSGCIPVVLPAQEIRIHSHNDYRQEAPFYLAHSQHASSIEADIYATGRPGELLVAHDPEELAMAPSLDETYLQPLVRLFRENSGRAWKDSDQQLTLLIDLKTPVNPTLERLVSKLQLYPEVFDPSANPDAVRVVISGNRPEPDDFGNYPRCISFDGNQTHYTPEQLERISMISFNLRNYTLWNGEGEMIDVERERVSGVIRQVHALGKPVRFWGAPDGVTAWKTFHQLGVDFINTDRPEACAAFFRDFHE